MKKFLCFILGMITMLVILVVLNLYTNHYYEGDDYYIPGLTIFSEKQTGDNFSYNSVKVIQVVEQGAALVLPNKELTFEPVILLLGEKTKSFYDNQIINIPKGFHLSQVGLYRYENKLNFTKTVPAVVIVKK